MTKYPVHNMSKTINADALFQSSVLAHQRGLLENAEKGYHEALRADPKHVGALHLMGVLNAQQGQYDSAVNYIRAAAEISPGDFSILNNLGNAYIKLERYGEALEVLTRAGEIYAFSGEVWNNRGNALYGMDRFREAIESYHRSLELRPDHPETICNQANALAELNRTDEALTCIARVFEIAPKMALAYSTRGRIFLKSNKVDHALQSYEASILLRPNYAPAIYGRGLCLFRLSRDSEAVEAFELVIALDPTFNKVYPQLAHVLFRLQRYVKALTMLQAATNLGVEADSIFGAMAVTKRKLCKWEETERDTAELIAHVGKGSLPIAPFHLLAMSDDLSIHQSASAIFSSAGSSPSVSTVPPVVPLDKDRIRIGYYSADFHNHATMRLMAETFELHDRRRFEIMAFSFGPHTDDALRRRGVSAFDKFLDVKDMSDIEVVALSRKLGIDIAVDLKGFTTDCRPGIFAARAAPIQVNYLGYPATMGAAYMDYIFADPVIIPSDLFKYYTEKVVHLPYTYQVNDGTRAIPNHFLTRVAAGLPTDGFVFCCFNNSYKITPQIFAVWMKILQRVPDSILWLFADNSEVERNLIDRATSIGADATRLFFAHRVGFEENMSRQLLPDLFLDTFPYNAHTTASDALWAGLPVLTLMGNSFASRVASSLLRAVGLPELITTSETEYEDLAVSLALNPTLVDQLRSRLIHGRTSAPLFNARVLTRGIEKAFVAIHERYHAGLPAEHVVIDPSNLDWPLMH